MQAGARAWGLKMDPGVTRMVEQAALQAAEVERVAQPRGGKAVWVARTGVLEARQMQANTERVAAAGLEIARAEMVRRAFCG